MIVKICGITNREDALAAAEMGASALGFNFYSGSLRFLTLGQAARIIEALPAAVWKVGVFVNEPPATVEAMVDQLSLDVAQLHGQESSADFPPDVRVWKALRVGAGLDRADFDRFPAEAILLDGPGSGKSFDWKLAAGIEAKIIIAGGLDAGNVRRAIVQAKPWGVDACSSLESSPGRKDHGKMARFLQAALA